MAKGEKTKVKKETAVKKSPEPAEHVVPPRLKERYHKDVVPKLMEQFGFTTPMRAPRIEKIVVNQGLGEAIANPKIVELAATTKPRVRASKK